MTRHAAGVDDGARRRGTPLRGSLRLASRRRQLGRGRRCLRPTPLSAFKTRRGCCLPHAPECCAAINNGAVSQGGSIRRACYYLGGLRAFWSASRGAAARQRGRENVGEHSGEQAARSGNAARAKIANFARLSLARAPSSYLSCGNYSSACLAPFSFFRTGGALLMSEEGGRQTLGYRAGGKKDAF